MRSHLGTLLAVALGGALGSAARWGLAEAVGAGRGELPWATWLANVGGAFLLGALMVLVLAASAPHRHLRPFLGVGVLGGFTTFSTYMLEARHLLAAGEAPLALVYVFGTLGTGLLAVWLGVVTARLVLVARTEE